MNHTPRIVLVEDSMLLREGLSHLLTEAGFQVVGAYESGDEMLAKFGDDCPDAAVLDVRLPPTFTDEGIRLGIQLRRDHPDLAVLILSQYVESLYAHELFSSGEGRVGYLLKDRVVTLASLKEAIERLLQGHTVLDPLVVSTLLDARRNPLQRLTDRERDVLQQMAQGLTNQEIAELDHVGIGTVEKHVASIFTKLDLDPSAGGNRRVLAVLTWLRENRV